MRKWNMAKAPFVPPRWTVIGDSMSSEVLATALKSAPAKAEPLTPNSSPKGNGDKLSDGSK